MKKGLFPLLFPIQSSHPFLQIPLWRRRRRLANLVVAFDKDIFGESTDIVILQKENLVAEVEEGPVLFLLRELLHEKLHLVVRGNGEDLHSILPLIVQAS